MLEVGPDRRKKHRFGIELAMTCCYRNRSVAGKTRNISSKGLLMQVADQDFRGFPVKCLVTAEVAWPAKIGDTVPMKLMVQGRVVRSAGKNLVIGIEKSEFFTCRQLEAVATRA